MKILRVYAKHVWGLQELELKLDGKSVLIEAGNRRGKSSILKTIRNGIEGTEPGTIHDYESEGRIEIDLEELSIERVVNEDSGTKSLIVLKHGERMKGAQKYLDRIRNSLRFNLTEFYLPKPGKTSKENARAQRDMLLNALPMEIDELEMLEAIAELTDGKLRSSVVSDVIDAEPPRWDRHALAIAGELYKRFYTERTELGRRIDTKLELIGGLSTIEAEPYDAERHGQVKAELARLVDALDDLAEAERFAATARQAADFAEQAAQTAQAEVARLEQQLAEAKQRRDDKTAARDEKLREAARAEISLDPELKAAHEESQRVLSAEHEKLEDVRRKNELRTDTEGRVAQARVDLGELEDEREQFDLACAFFKDQLPQALIAKAKLPVAGLEVDENNVLIHGRPLTTLSGQEQLTVALMIAEKNGSPTADEDDDLKFILIDDAEKLDGDAMDILEERAARGDIQFIITKVNPAGGPLTTREFGKGAPA